MDFKKEKTRVLELLSEGVLSALEAENILSALEQKEKKYANKSKILKISIKSVDKEEVNINVPLEFAKLLKSKKFNTKINNLNIDIDSIIEISQSGAIGEVLNITSPDGTKVKIMIE